MHQFYITKTLIGFELKRLLIIYNSLKVKFLVCLSLLIINLNIISGQSNAPLKKIDSYSIPLDLNYGFVADAIQYFTLKEVTYLALSYRNSRTINVYNFTSKKLDRTIELDKEGSNGIGSEIASFYIEDFDNIYVYSYWERTIFLVTSKSKIKDKYKIPDGTNFPIIEPHVMCPMLKVKNFLYLTGVFVNSASKTENPLLKIDFKNKTTKSLGTPPFVTRKWNFYRKNWPKFDYVAGKDFFVIGYDMLDSIYLLNGDISNRFYAKSKFLDNATLPLSRKNDSGSSTNSKDELNAYLVGDSYWGIKYDPFRKCYYRFGVRGRTLKEAYALARAKAIIMVLDENLKIIGEMELPQELYIDMVFVTEKGLFIANKRLYEQVDENKLTFDIYSLK